jgi:hypothetical protein
MKWLALAVGSVLLLAALGAFAWACLLYPDVSDRKNMRYVLWKHGLVTIDPDRALAAIAEDPDGKQDLIMGQTKAQLRGRFGLLLTPRQAGLFLEHCVQGSWAKDKDAVFLRHSNLIVAFENGVATNADLLKPC